MQTNLDRVVFDYSETERKLFDPKQYKYWDNIEKNYFKIKEQIVSEVNLPQSCSHKEWITSRVHLNVSQSLMRLLYLTEEFCNASNTFNSASSAALIKSIVEIPLYLGYIVWILDENHDFDKVRSELHKIAFGNRDSNSGLTISGKVTHKDLYTKSDYIIEKLFQKDKSTIKIFERLYKDSNATGHHNFEARMLTGIQNKDTWRAGDRKELFVFFSNTVFPFFMHCDAALGISTILLKAINHDLDHLPNNFTS